MLASSGSAPKVGVVSSSEIKATLTISKRHRDQELDQYQQWMAVNAQHTWYDACILITANCLLWMAFVVLNISDIDMALHFQDDLEEVIRPEHKCQAKDHPLLNWMSFHKVAWWSEDIQMAHTGTEQSVPRDVLQSPSPNERTDGIIGYATHISAKTTSQIAVRLSNDKKYPWRSLHANHTDQILVPTLEDRGVKHDQHDSSPRPLISVF
jgi:hypothetical protein